LRCKKWYYEDNISEENITAILEIEKMSLSSEDKVADGGEATLAGVDIEIHKKIYVKIPFHKKNDAKKHGCRWDAQKKSWYYMSNLEKNKIDSIIKLEE
jgi:hypothetical protein